MNKLASFDKPRIRALRSEIEQALSTVSRKHGITLSLGTIRFSAGEFRGKLTGRTANGALAHFTALTPSPNGFYSGVGSGSDSLLQNALRVYDLPADAKHFRVGRTVYTLTSAKLSRPKYPFIGQGPQGGRYRFSVSQVKNGLIK